MPKACRDFLLANIFSPTHCSMNYIPKCLHSVVRTRKSHIFVNYMNAKCLHKIVFTTRFCLNTMIVTIGFVLNFHMQVHSGFLIFSIYPSLSINIQQSYFLDAWRVARKQSLPKTTFSILSMLIGFGSKITHFSASNFLEKYKLMNVKLSSQELPPLLCL